MSDHIKHNEHLNQKTVTFSARATDTTLISKYGGFQFSKLDLDNLKNQFDTQDIKFHLDHDPELVLDIRAVGSHVREVENGNYGLFVDFETDTQTFAQLPKGFDGITPLGGISLTVIEPFGSSTSGIAEISFAADAANWTSEDLVSLGNVLAQTHTVNASKLYQFSVETVAFVAIQILHDVGVGVLSNVIYELFSKAKTKPVTFSIKISQSDTEKEVIIKASDIETLKAGIDSLKCRIWNE